MPLRSLKIKPFSLCRRFAKRDSNRGAFLSILQNFQNTPILKNICKRLLLSIVLSVILRRCSNVLISNLFCWQRNDVAFNIPKFQNQCQFINRFKILVWLLNYNVVLPAIPRRCFYVLITTLFYQQYNYFFPTSYL